MHSKKFKTGVAHLKVDPLHFDLEQAIHWTPPFSLPNPLGRSTSFQADSGLLWVGSNLGISHHQGLVDD